MKKYVVLATAVVIALELVWSAFGQPAGGAGSGSGPRTGPPMGGQRGFRGGPRGFLNVESTNRAVQAIEEQLAAIKTAMEGAEPLGGRGGPGAPGAGGDFRAMMEQMRKRTEAVQTAAAAIAEQVLVLKGRRAGMEFQEGIAELQSIVASATAEQATKTSQLVQGIIDARQKTFQETAARLGIAVPGRRGGRGSPGMGGPGPGLEALEDPSLGESRQWSSSRRPGWWSRRYEGRWGAPHKRWF